MTISFFGTPISTSSLAISIHSSSPFQWTVTQVFPAFSPLERTLAISQGLESLAGNAAGARCEFSDYLIGASAQQNEEEGNNQSYRHQLHGETRTARNTPKSGDW